MNDKESKYEIACVFRPEESNFEVGKKEFLAVLEKLGMKVESEEDMGIRSTYYAIKKNWQAHYVVFHVLSKTSAISSVANETRLQDNLLRFLTVKM